METPRIETERRNFLRLDRTSPIHFRVLERNLVIPETGNPTGAIMKNLSTGGVCFMSPVQIEPARMLALQLDLPGVEGSLLCMGKTVWCRRLEVAIPRYEIGVEFHWVGPRDAVARGGIHTFLQKALDEYDTR